MAFHGYGQGSPHGQGFPPGYGFPPGRGFPGGRRGRTPTGYLVTVAVLASLGATFDGLAFYVSIFATDSCGPHNPALVCTTFGLLSMWALPWVGLALAVAVSVGFGLWAARRGRTPWVYLPAGVLLYAASLLGAWTIMVS